MDSQEPVIITPTQAEMDRFRGYSSHNMWRGYKNYECLDCQYKTIYLDKMTKHIIAGVHVWAFPGGVKEDPDLVEFPDDGPVY